MSKNISFSSDELEEIRAFYQQELSKADQRVKNLKAIVSKLGAEPKKRGRKSTKPVSNDLEISAVISEIKSKGSAKSAKRGRKAGVPNKPKSAVTPASISKTKSAPPAAKKPLRKTKTAVVKPVKAAKISKPAKAAKAVKVAKPAKAIKPLKVAKAVKTAKVGKPEKATKPVVAKKANSVLTGETANLVAGEKKKRITKPKVVKTPKLAKVAVVKSPATSEPAKVEKKTIVVKSDKPKATTPKVKTPAAKKSVKSIPKKKTAVSKLEVVAKGTASKTGNSSSGSVVKIALSKPLGKVKVVKVKSEIKKPVQADDDAIKRRKSQWTSFLLDFLGSEKRFISTPDIIDAGQKKFKLSGKEKDTAKNTIQATLFRLGSEKQIQSRKKDSSRIAFWAANGVNDEEFVSPEKSETAAHQE
jgi:hypothetical protein